VSLSTDTLLFSVVLGLAAVQAALPHDGGSNGLLLAAFVVAVLGLLGSVASSVSTGGPDPAGEGSPEE